ncbi:Cysteine desulfurase, SufS subfamily [Candidatus Methanomethylophilus alvi Mx1201]|uniref:cysteine desulfurase n=2 Tax=Methanomethylophilus alvi TaxID=1291540 RepID=M9SJH7_METAX|nr:cysteine desulfurase [Methanomethylophilus alvi]AGI85672.1 Cysteine desulfurase, SufS subfamily [Candidatus Methanomethylophilus alvi Mx1201]AYQ55079.1 cysteine desulfurase [Methanomethylophilus alvi]
MIDTEQVRKDFPMYRNGGMYGDRPLHYLDNAATTFKPRQVIEASDRYYTDICANTKRGDYALAHDADVAYDESRETVARFINADPEEVVFTSGDTMGLNFVAYGLMPGLKKGDEIVLSWEEHASNALPWFRVAQITGASIKYVPLTEDGRITPENLKSVVNENTKVVALASISNVLGRPLPVRELARIAHSVGAVYVDDGAQSVPHSETDVRETDVDFLCFSGHKMLGPTGIGVMYGKRERLEGLEPLFYGGEMNARFDSSCSISLSDVPDRFEAGTQNMSGAMGLAEACRYIESIGFRNIRDHERKLKRMAVDGMLANGNAVLYNADSDTGIVTFNINGVFAQDAASYLGDRGVFVRSGTHCAKILPEFLKTQATVRASMYIYNDEDDVKALVEASRHAEDFLDVFFN